MQLSSLVLFSNALRVYMVNNYGADGIATDWDLIDGVTYNYEHSFTMTIAMACFYATAAMTSWIAVLLLTWQQHVLTTHRNQTAPSSSRSIEMQVIRH